MSNPAIVVHIQDGHDTVIVEGRATPEINHAVLAALARIASASTVSPDWSDSRAQVVFRVQPRVAHAWPTPRMHTNLVNFFFWNESASKGARAP